MNILVTAIGSMSAECVISGLKSMGYYVLGCDIYPREWHYEGKLCDSFEQAPLATEQGTYIGFLLDCCNRYNTDYIIPLTDLEIDVINNHRALFDAEGIKLCMPRAETLAIVRNKYLLSQYFVNDDCVPTIKTCMLANVPSDWSFPCIAKPYNGRSSEGLIRNATRELLRSVRDKDDYILQESIDGPVYTVDYCRNHFTHADASMAREELLRTKNGAGLTVRVVNDDLLTNQASHIGQALGIHGCINMEFIRHEGMYYLIDINPRFSAGVAFSCMAGYDMVLNHLRCFVGGSIDSQTAPNTGIYIKKYTEVAY